MNLNKEYDLELKIGLFGAGAVGKSSIAIRFVEDKFIEEYDPTIEEEFRKEIDFNNKKILLRILDTAGCQEYWPYIENLARGYELFIYVYSITDRNSYKEIFHYYNSIKKYKSENHPKVLIGNKSDLTMKRAISIEEGKELANKLNCKFIETSAKNGENINQLFYEIISFKIPNQNENQNQNQNENEKKKKGKCLLM
ncbi:ras gtpase [Anaeramoeba ignava]|uniref:Ras gtpase n=1 Tax=Anaeramoeba ignava TaxID=1746090 RepID=A0A9Q0LEF0_ANAIG|nr:ras gtpase [Anaeramoeba ignava]